MIISRKQLIYAILVCSLGSIPYFYDYFLQVAPSVLGFGMMRDFGLDAAGLGLLSAVFYASYTPMQLVGGVLLDRYGPRLLLSFACLICGAGALLMGYSHQLWLAYLGRLLIGCGGAFTFSSALLLLIHWLPERWFTAAAGVLQALGAIGAMTGGILLAELNRSMDWREALIYSAWLGAAITVLMILIVRDKHQARKVIWSPGLAAASRRKRLRAVFQKSQTWAVGCYSLLIWSPMVILAVLWGPGYLVTKYPISMHEAAYFIGFIWVGNALASPLVGWWADRHHSRTQIMQLCTGVGVTAAVAMLYVSQHGLWFDAICLFLLGASTSIQVVTFSVVRDNNHRQQIGTAMGFNNMAVVISGFLLQPLVSGLIDLAWSGQYVDGIPVYQLHDYEFGLAVLPLCLSVAWLISRYWIREPRTQVETGLATVQAL